MRSSFKLELEEARHMVAAAIRKSSEIGVLETVCVADEGGYPLALERMDRARVTGPQIAWNKAFTAAGHKRSTHLFNQAPGGPALPGNEAFGIQWSFEGRFAVFVGGFPIVVDDDHAVRARRERSAACRLWTLVRLRRRVRRVLQEAGGDPGDGARRP